MKKCLILLVAVIYGCYQATPKTLSKTSASPFRNYLKSLDAIPLPFSHSCDGLQFPNLSSHFDSSGFKKYKQVWTVKPLGILFNDNQNIVTVDLGIGDYCLVPFMTSFDQNGHKLDSLGPYDRGGQDSDSMIKPCFKVSRNKHIVIVDTIKHWKLDSKGDEISGSETVTLDSSIYILSKKGKFIKEATRKK